MIKQLTISLALALTLFSTAFAQLTPEQQAARDKGLELYQQHMGVSAIEPLRIAAEAGDITAQYYLGETLRLNNMFMTAEARKWYEAAAEQGDLFSMLRLSNASDLCKELGTCSSSGPEWREKALSLAYERAEKCDTEAMIALYVANQGIVWLEKAAEAGDSFAQQLLAGFYQDGEGWFFLPGSREEAIGKWLKASAEGGFPEGMMHYANYLYENNGSKEDIRYWVKMAAEAGLISAVSTYALNVAHNPDDLGYALDLVKGYGLNYLLSRLQGGGTGPEDGQRALSEIAKKMTAEQIEQAKIFAAEWEKTHPPLSYFVPVYGY